MLLRLGLAAEVFVINIGYLFFSSVQVFLYVFLNSILVTSYLDA